MEKKIQHLKINNFLSEQVLYKYASLHASKINNEYLQF